MNLWLRLMMYLCGFGRGAPSGDWPFSVWPTDLDINGHVNNGRFLELMDLGRFDWFWRGPLRATVFKFRSVPILGGVMIRYRLPLDTGQRIVLKTRLLCFEDNWMVMEQRFVFASGEKANVVAAIALCKCGFYDRRLKKIIDPRAVFTHHNLPLPDADVPDVVTDWRQADLSLKALTQRI